jgi:hypothetical protein
MSRRGRNSGLPMLGAIAAAWAAAIPSAIPSAIAASAAPAASRFEVAEARA